MEAFGNADLGIDHEWPKEEDLKKFPLGKKIKLARIGVKIYNEDFLSGI